jgi:hypothetical protein
MGNKSTKGKKWFNDGKTNRLFFPNEVPDSSWKLGE